MIAQQYITLMTFIIDKVFRSRWIIWQFVTNLMWNQFPVRIWVGVTVEASQDKSWFLFAGSFLRRVELEVKIVRFPPLLWDVDCGIHPKEEPCPTRSWNRATRAWSRTSATAAAADWAEAAVATTAARATEVPVRPRPDGPDSTWETMGPSSPSEGYVFLHLLIYWLGSACFQLVKRKLRNRECGARVNHARTVGGRILRLVPYYRSSWMDGIDFTLCMQRTVR